MSADRKLSPWKGLALVAAQALLLGGCAQGGAPPSPTASPSSEPMQSPLSGPTRSASAKSGSPACDLITPEIAVKIDPGLAQMGPGGKPAGSQGYVCSYMSKAEKVLALTVSLISPASAAEIAETKKTPDCSVIEGIGDFACMQWSGWFRGESGGASANTVLKAVRGNESLDLRIVAMPPMSPDTPGPDGGAAARALAQALVEGGWGNGAELRVPPAPPVGPQTETNNPVCALVSVDALKQAFGTTTQAQVLPGEGNCRYHPGAPVTNGPDSLMFSVEFMRAGLPCSQGTCRGKAETSKALATRPSCLSGHTPADQECSGPRATYRSRACLTWPAADRPSGETNNRGAAKKNAQQPERCGPRLTLFHIGPPGPP